MLTLYITRHGETSWNTEKRMQGWSDSELTLTGVNNASLLAKSLRDIEFDAIYSSTSNRSVKTAEIIRGKWDVPITLKENLREINMGDWEGKTITYIEENFPEKIYSFWNTPHLYQPIMGEDFFNVRKRVELALKDIIKNHDSGNVLIVTHSITIKTILAYFKQLPMDRLWEPPFIHDTSLTIITKNNNQYEIVLEGDLSHRDKGIFQN